MSLKQVVELLDGQEICHEMDKIDEQKLKESGIVIVFGASDDLMELRGAINDEIGACDGGVAYLNNSGLIVNECDNEECPHFEKAKEMATKIIAQWCQGQIYAWTFETDIPHETFDILEDGEKWCRGIVFFMLDVK